MWDLIKPFLLMAFSFLIITACYSRVTQKADISTGHLVTPSECRVVQHKLGKTCIPIKPNRIIALEPRYALDPLLAIGIKPIGFASYIEQGKTFTAGVSHADIADIENVGRPDQPSFEKIVLLNPDLILALDIQQNEQNYKLLSAITPTILIDYDKIKLSFKDNLQSLAQLFDQEERAKEIIEHYQHRIEKLRSQLGNQPYKVTVSTISYENGSFYGYSNETGISQVLTDIGVTQKAVASDSPRLSIEVINEYDADILFISSISKPATSILQHPLISSLKAVKNHRAYVVNQDIWWAYGPLGISHLLDDLEKYFVNTLE